MKTRLCIFGDHIVTGEDADMMGQFVEDGFVCNAHLESYQQSIDPDDDLSTEKEESDEENKEEKEEDDNEEDEE